MLNDGRTETYHSLKTKIIQVAYFNILQVECSINIICSQSCSLRVSHAFDCFLCESFHC